MEDLVEALEEMFADTAEAHHEPCSATQGIDPEWALWYADSTRERLSGVLETESTKSDLIYLLLKMHYDQQANAPGSRWTRYSAHYLAEAYG